jgi:hypothetical protein
MGGAELDLGSEISERPCEINDLWKSVNSGGLSDQRCRERLLNRPSIFIKVARKTARFLQQQ